MNKRLVILVLSICILTTGIFAGGQDEKTNSLVINSNLSDPSVKASLAEAVELFKGENPDLDVQLNTFDHEAYKTAIRNFLVTEAPDICPWFAGNRMKFFVDEGLFMDVSDVWKKEGLNISMASSLKALTVDGKQYGVPFSYYQWVYMKMLQQIHSIFLRMPAMLRMQRNSLLS